MNSTLEEILSNAVTAIKDEDYHELLESITALSSHMSELDENQRLVLLETYKCAIRSRRESYFLQNANHVKASILNSKEDMEHFQATRDKNCAEGLRLCDQLLDYISESLIPLAKSYETLVDFHKARGDTYRYIASLSLGKDEKNTASQQAVNCYMEAMEVANKNLPLASTARLTAVLNLTVFNYDILKNPTTSIQIIRSVLTELEPVLPTLPSVEPRAMRTIERMQKNLIFWENDIELKEMERKMNEKQKKRSGQ
jgi:14-3-3 protein epsilon